MRNFAAPAELQNNELEDTAVVMVGDGVELDIYLFLKDEWTAIENGCVVMYLNAENAEAEPTELEYISAIRLGPDGVALSALNIRLTVDLVSGLGDSLCQSDAIRCLIQFIGGSPAFLYGALQIEIWQRHIVMLGDACAKYLILDARDVAYFTWMHLQEHSLEMVVDHIHCTMASWDASGCANAIVTVLLTALDQAKELHRLLSTFPILRIPNGETMDATVFTLSDGYR